MQNTRLVVGACSTRSRATISTSLWSRTTIMPGARPILLLCGGRFASEVADVAQAQGCKIIGVLDDSMSPGTEILEGIDVVGKLSDALSASRLEDAELFCANGDPNIRALLHTRFQSAPWASLTSPLSSISPSASIGPGAFVGQFSFVGPKAKIGKSAIVNVLCSLGHDVIVGDNVVLCPGTMAAGGAHIGTGTFVGQNATVAPRVTIAPYSIIGAQTNVMKPIEDAGLYVGNPAARKK